MNLETLRLKRIKKLGVKRIGYSGQRRIFSLLDRATSKFHGNVALWMQYLWFARKQKARKKISVILTNVLRLHPTRPELWIYAAKYAFEEHGNITEARSYLQRGLRFCRKSNDQRSVNVWCEYAKLEMIHIAKVVRLGQSLSRTSDEARNNLSLNLGDAELDIRPTNSDLEAGTPIDNYIDPKIMMELQSTPMLSGAIPVAIFDAAMKEYNNDVALGEKFFNMIAQFANISCTKDILQHIVDHLLVVESSSPVAIMCSIRQPLVCAETLSSEFPSALGIALDRLNTAMRETLLSNDKQHHRVMIADRAIDLFLSFIIDGLDPNIHKVLVIALKRLWKEHQADVSNKPSKARLKSLLKTFRDKNLQEVVETPVSFIAGGAQDGCITHLIF